MTATAVQLRNVTKVYSAGRHDDGVTAVRDVNLSIEQGEFFTLLGPSGCGKTTTLRLIAGFETPSAGQVLIQERPMQNTAPNGRPVNTVFQNYALFPHLSVGENVAFGLKVKRVTKDERQQRVRAALDLVRLSDLADRRPSQLSGGQQQRVALARAIVNRPVVLLLDEPLGALDLKLRKEMQLELKRLQAQLGITFIYVTHDQEEALTMSDRIAVMRDGILQQVADPVTLYEAPTNRFVADFIGESNFLRGAVGEVQSGSVWVQIAGLEQPFAVSINGHQLRRNQDVTLTVRPEKLELLPPNGADVPLEFVQPAIVREVVYIGADTRYLVELSAGETLIVRQPNMSGRGGRQFTVGDHVGVRWQPDDLRVLAD